MYGSIAQKARLRRLKALDSLEVTKADIELMAQSKTTARVSRFEPIEKVLSSIGRAPELMAAA